MDLLAILNTIRDNGSATYQERIPEATRTNLDDIRYAMIDQDNIIVANEFMSTLLNKVVKDEVHHKTFNNPLKSLKRGKKPLGDSVQEIYVNFMKGAKYDPAGADLMSRNLPDAKTVWHRMNYQQQYSITVSRDMLSKAFSSWEALDSFISNIINSLYNSADLDEFMNMKQLLKSAYDKKALKVVEIPDPLLSEANGKEFIKTVKTISGQMAFPSSEFNSYLTAQTTDTKPVITLSRKNEQVIIIDTATDTAVSVDVLASLFNMSVAEFNDTRKIIIDYFPVDGMRAAIVDEAFLQVWDDLFVVTEWYNPKGLYTNYYLNVWQTLAFSILLNAVAFVVGTTA